MSSPPFQRWCPRGRNGGSDCSMPRRGNNLIRPSVEKGLDLEHRKRSQDRVAGVDVDRMAYEEDALAMLDSIYRLALWLTPREADARDLVQETYLRALEARATFRPAASMRAWLARILRNRLIDLLRQSGRAVPWPERAEGAQAPEIAGEGAPG